MDEIVAEWRVKVAENLSARATELTQDLVALYDRELPELVHDDESIVSLLAASVFQNLDTATRIFQHGIDPRTAEAPTAALEYARRLAQRGTPVIKLIRAYYLGQMAILDRALEEGARQIEDVEVLAKFMRELVEVGFAFIDTITQTMVTTYEAERDRWLRNRSAVRAARVRSLLDDGVADLDASESAIAYRLRGEHVGLIVWYPEGGHPDGALAALEQLADKLAAAGDARPLLVPCDERCAWVWLPVTTSAPPPGRAELEQALDDVAAGARLSIGEPAQGLEGFRRTHRQAQRVHSLAVAAGPSADRVLMFSEVGAAALMAADLDAARSWVVDTLGKLATDDEQHARLRETLRVFLAAGGSYTATAGKLMMHKNSVQYRIRKAEESLGRQVADDRLDVELALNLSHHLGRAVLAP